MSDSGFDTFPRDYRSINWIDNNTWEKRKVYNNAPYLVLPGQKYHIRLTNLLPNFVCYIYVPGEQFGDPLPFPLSGNRIIFYLYDAQNNLVIRDTALVSNLDLGEVTYEWKALDIQQEGVYTFEVEVIDEVTSKSFRLPDGKTRYEIIVTK